MKSHQILRYILIGIITILIAYYIFPPKSQQKDSNVRDYAEIVASDTIHVAVEYNAISYHVENDTLVGFNYELVQAFARDHHLVAHIIPDMGFDSRLQGLKQGKYDIIAYGIPTTSELKDSLALTIPIFLSKETLVQRKASSPDDTLFIRNQLDLARKTLYVTKDSPVILRINNLSNEIADTIYIKEVDKYGPEQLIALVAHGDIDYAVCNATIARIAADSLPQIDTEMAIGFTQFYSWGVNKQSTVLLDTLNSWLKGFKESEEYTRIYDKYHK